MKNARSNADQPRSNCDFDILLERELTSVIIGVFFVVYNQLGFGFLESVYRKAMYYELTDRGLMVETEVPIDVWYGARKVGHFRADLLVERKVILEIKCAEASTPADRRQLVNYLRATGVEVGLLFNFGPKATYERMVYSKRTK
jgi:GxxExxY protein